jgi:hypothetical protein
MDTLYHSLPQKLERAVYTTNRTQMILSHQSAIGLSVLTTEQIHPTGRHPWQISLTGFLKKLLNTDL